MATALPIIYVRGFAGRTSGIDEAVNDPFYGFNAGSTHVRVGSKGKPRFHQFESPLLRLLIDHEYELHVQGDQRRFLERQRDQSVSTASIWIHRFYDVSASTFDADPQAFNIENAADDLKDLVELVRRKTSASRVNLVAHSMGGLICRCLIQKKIPEADEGKASDLIQRLFTYATPHGGIEFGLGALEWLRDTFNIAGGNIFGRDRMYEYLTPAPDGTDPRTWRPGRPPKNWDPLHIPDDVFPSDRIFSLIGTNPGDYEAAMGLSSKVVGVKSDGLVQIDNAYLPAAKFAFVHRSHSGRYGIVNSEEGYQNLRRFLLGDLEVQADLVGLGLPDHDDNGELLWQAEIELAVRGLPILMHQQVAAHHCPIDLNREDDSAPDDTADRPVPLVTTFLIADPEDRPAGAGHARYSLRVRVLSLRERRGFFDFGDHLEQSSDFDDLLIVDVGVSNGRLAAWAKWNSDLPMALRDYTPTGGPLQDEEAAAGVWVSTVELPAQARRFLGRNAALRLTVRDRGDARERLAETASDENADR